MNHFTKYLGLVLIFTGLIACYNYPSTGAEVPLLVGLFILFISKQGKEDERAITIRTSSGYIALILGYGIQLILNNLYSHQLISLQLSSINHFLILVFLLGVILRYSRLYLFHA